MTRTTFRYLGLLLALSACSTSSSGSAQPANTVGPTRPADEVAFVKLATDARYLVDHPKKADETRPADDVNDETSAARDKAICKLLHKPFAVTGWIGAVNGGETSVATGFTGDGFGQVEVALADQVSLSTGQSEATDVNDSRIPSSSPLIAVVASLSDGDVVRFSGRFTPDDERCLDEVSLTSLGHAYTPTWTFTFTALQKI